MTQNDFDRFVEFYNDQEVTEAIEVLCLVEANREIHLEKVMILNILDFYTKRVHYFTNGIDLKTIDDKVMNAQIEDEIWFEFKIEMNEIRDYCSKIDDQDILKDSYDKLRNSLSIFDHR